MKNNKAIIIFIVVVIGSIYLHTTALGVIFDILLIPSGIYLLDTLKRRKLKK